MSYALRYLFEPLVSMFSSRDIYVRFAPLWLLALVVAGCPARDRVVGQPCESDDSCVPDTTCAAVRRQPDGAFVYECIDLCLPENAYRCPNGELCWFARADRFDLFGCFPGGTDPLGGSCTYVPNCERGLACESVPPPDGSEPTVGLCVPGCVLGPCWEGEPCRYFRDCDTGLECVAVRHDGDGFAGECVRECRLGVGAFAGLCDDGRTCIRLHASGPGTGCVPGGDRVVGAACEYAFECVRGAVCVATRTGAGECALACNDSADCPGTSTCVDSHCE